MFLSAFRVLDGYLFHRNRYLCAMLLVSVAGANAAGAPAAAVPLLPAELSTLVTAAIRNHPAARSAQAKRRAALQDVAAAERSKWSTLTATTESKVGGGSKSGFVFPDNKRITVNAAPHALS